MEVSRLNRKFILKRNGNEVVLEDLNPNMTHEQIREAYSNTYPELINCNVNPKGIINDEEVIEFSTVAGTKG